MLRESLLMHNLVITDHLDIYFFFVPSCLADENVYDAKIAANNRALTFFFDIYSLLRLRFDRQKHAQSFATK